MIVPGARPLDRCLACDHPIDSGCAYLDLGMQPLANDYHAPGKDVPRFPLRVALCSACRHSQLTVSVDPRYLYANYLYVSGTTETLRRHQRELAEEAVAQLDGIGREPAVLDIGCNDGTLLEAFRALGCHVMGVDPAENLRPITRGKCIDVEVGMWPACAGALGTKFDLVTGCNCLAHNPDPAGFLRAAADVILPGGLVVVEFPHAADLFLQREWDTIYHEHLSYFTAGSFRALADRCGLRIVAARRTPIHGGSVRYYLQPGETPHEDVGRMVAEEEAQGLRSRSFYDAFAAGLEATRAEFRHLLGKEADAGRKLVAYGASAKGSTAANFLGLPGVRYVVDDNPMKRGLLTPGTDLAIRTPAMLGTELGPLSIVLLAWNFADEIKRRVRAIRGADRGDRFVHYVPQPRVEE